jgi:hypothetical protein
MKKWKSIQIVKLVFVIALPGVAQAVAAKCPKDSVQVGTTCVDKYEASVWQIPASNTKLINKVKGGLATLADLQAGGAAQLGCNFAPFNHADYPASFPVNGQWTPVVGSRPRVRGFDPGSSAERLHHLVPGGAGLRALGKAAAVKPRVAGRGGGHARSRDGGRRVHHLRDELRKPGNRRLAVGLCVQLGRFRHDWQRLGVGQRLG